MQKRLLFKIDYVCTIPPRGVAGSFLAYSLILSEINSLDLFNTLQMFTSVNLFVFQYAGVLSKLYLLPNFILSLLVERQ